MVVNIRAREHWRRSHLPLLEVGMAKLPSGEGIEISGDRKT